MDDVSSREGKGHIVLSQAGDTSSQVLSTLSFQYPLKLISPRLPGQPCTSVFMMSYGGGLVGGDEIDLSVVVESDTKLCLLTQGSTKIFKQRKIADRPTSTTSQILRVKIENGALLALLPDPIQPFADSIYNQYQSFELHPDSSLLLLDWVNSGRPARGENWTLASYLSRNDILVASGQGVVSRLLLRDTLILNNTIANSMYPHECFATVILRGPLLREFSDSVIAKFRSEDRVRRQSTVRATFAKKRATWTAGIVREGCCVVKIAGETGEIVKEFLSELLVVNEMESLLGREALRSVIL
jgi:urease accessory protein UreH